jgi:polyphosphate kinase
LLEAANPLVPLYERIKFLLIYSSNLDEFYRVRMPYLQKKSEIGDKHYSKAIVKVPQDLFGKILHQYIIPEWEEHPVDFCYNMPIPETVIPFVTNYFYTQLAGFLHPIHLSENSTGKQTYLIKSTTFVNTLFAVGGYP